MGLQHIIAVAIGVITPAILVTDACGLGSADKTLMIRVSLILTALATLLQPLPIFHRIGSGLSVTMGINFACIPTLQVIGGEFSLPTILDAGIVRDIIAIVFGAPVKWIRPLFPPLVTGTVIFAIGLSPYPIVIKYMTGGVGSEWFSSAKSWAVALITLAVVVFLNRSTKGITKLAPILISILAGYVIAYSLGVVDLSGVGNATWAILSRPMPFGIQFVPTACVSLDIVYVVNAVQTIGDLSSTTVGDMSRMPTDKELSGDIVGQGVMSIPGAFFGGLPTTTYSQNMGIITVNRVANQAVFVLAALILLMAELVPKLTFLLTTIPQCVIGGTTISVFTTIAVIGIHTIIEGDFTPRKSSVVDLSVVPDVGITQVSDCLAGEDFPAWVNTVFGPSSVVVAIPMVILLNLILSEEPFADG